MRRPKASWNAIISAFLHALNFAPSLGACALPLTGVSALCFKGVLFPPQQRLLFKANNYNASYVKPHKIIIENSIFFPYLFRKKVDLRFASNMKLHYQNTFVIKKMYRFSNMSFKSGNLLYKSNFYLLSEATVQFWLKKQISLDLFDFSKNCWPVTVSHLF